MIVSVPSSQIDCSLFALSAVQPVQPSLDFERQVGRENPNEINAPSNLSNLFLHSFGKVRRDRAEGQRAAPRAAWEGTESKLVGQVGQVGRVNDSNGLRGGKVGRRENAGWTGWTRQDGLQPIIGSSLGAAPAGTPTPEKSLFAEKF